MESAPDRVHATNFVLQRLLVVGVVCLGMGVLFDQLFFDKLPGISFPLYVLLTLAVIFWSAHLQRRRIPKTALYMVPLLLFFSGMVFVRAGNLLTFINTVTSLYLLALFVTLVFRPRLGRYTFKDYLSLVFTLPIKVLGKVKESLAALLTRNVFVAKHQSLPGVLRGILIAVPVLLLFVILFSSADLVFRQYVSDLFRFNIDIEFWWRTFWVLFVGLFFFGLFNLFEHKAQAEPEAAAKVRTGRGAITEVAILLSSLNVLFLCFILIQLAYLFGGAANVTQGSFTYAEYARKGFFELIAVAGLSYLLIFVSERLLLRQGQRHTLQFKVLSGALVVQVLIVLISAFKRLALYENAYGYTSLRLYSHIFIIWLAVVLLALLYKIFADKRESALAFYMFVSVMALFVSFNVLNIDVMVAHKNLDRYQATNKLDLFYIANLSDDAVTQIAPLLDSKDPKVRDTMAYYLYWRWRDLQKRDGPWQSANITRKSALRTLDKYQALLDQNKDKLIDPGYRGPGH